MIKKTIFFIVLLLAFAKYSFAEWELTPSAEIATSSADLNWSIAGSIFGTNPNIISELAWQDLKIDHLKLNVVAKHKNRIYLRGHLNFGDIYSGSVQDSDYAFDNRTGEFSRSNSDASAGSTFDSSMAVGFPMQLVSRERFGFTLVPLVGFSYHEQNLKMRNGVQTVSDTALARSEGIIEPLESIPDVGTTLTSLTGAPLNSSYKTQWEDVWLGLDVLFLLRDRHQLSLSIEYHIADYYAAANWNLRTDLDHPVSFAQWADASGAVVSLDWSSRIVKKLLIGAGITYQHWETDAGTATFYDLEANPGLVTAISTQFNGAEWTSTSVHFRVGYQFDI